MIIGVKPFLRIGDLVKRRQGETEERQIPKPSSFTTGLGKIQNTFPENRRLGETETRRNGCFADGLIWGQI